MYQRQGTGTCRLSGNDGLVLSEDSKEARVAVGGTGGEEGRRRDLRGTQNMSEVSLSLCVSCFVGDKITFCKRKRWYGSVLFLKKNILSWQNKMWETLCRFLEIFGSWSVKSRSLCRLLREHLVAFCRWRRPVRAPGPGARRLRHAGGHAAGCYFWASLFRSLKPGARFRRILSQ